MTDIEFEEITDEQGQGLPQRIQVSADALIGQLIRRYGAQVQTQTIENAQLGAENEQLKTMLTETKAEAAEAEATIVELVGQLESVEKRIAGLEGLVESAQATIRRNAAMTEQLSPTDDPQPVDGFLAMAAGQPGLAGAPSPADT